jgi:beta-glucuronidase
MIYPQSNSHRQVKDISGFWDFRFDRKNEGLKKKWFKGLAKTQPLAVPASWNDQLEEGKNNLGPAWYQTRFDLPTGFKDKRVFLRFDSVNFLAEVWLNGIKLGQHEGGHLPFVFEITPKIKAESNLLVVRVEGLLKPDRVPPGNVPFDPKDAFNNTFYPPASFDFFPYCGIQRPVLLYTIPLLPIEDVTLSTKFKSSTGIVKTEIKTENNFKGLIRLTLTGFGQKVVKETRALDRQTTLELKVPQVRLWNPAFPHLYDLKIELLDKNQPIDQVHLTVGIRTIAVKGSKLLLNGKSIQMKGFGRHEDFPVAGRGYLPPVIIRDYDLMRWIGADSFRTTHYPYSDQMMDLADRLGFLVIAETPAVGLFFKQEGLANRQRLCRQYTKKLIERDKNHPSVIAWSLANEPHSHRSAAKSFFKNLIQFARKLDKTRPVTLVSYLGLKEESFADSDLVCVNRYYGWYSEPGRLPEAFERLTKDLDAIFKKFKKPILLTEFGADAIPGCHANPPEMFSEEYQADLLEGYWKILSAKPYVAGAHVWNLCDFKTAQATHRPSGMNYKGVFTRERQPKLAAHRLRKLWKKE